ncbi:DUF2267 domain-containing protein [Hyphococcus luteus]|uniref:Uncharacterized protein n=1 Tax=Hyphococcus luteus TaxID=2058213 RepID=A0A2S7JZ05_9PROT|nr:DUF2267 domain-containing protein [Marinicaulis flavus]PQA85480.1 hypothetical protein CW354_21285 [Marinicaulis flavus]
MEFASGQHQKWLVALKDKAMLATLNQAQAMMRAVMAVLRASVFDEDALETANALPPEPGRALAAKPPAALKPLWPA